MEIIFERKILKKMSPTQITVRPAKVTHRLGRSLLYGEISRALLNLTRNAIHLSLSSVESVSLTGVFLCLADSAFILE